MELSSHEPGSTQENCLLEASIAPETYAAEVSIADEPRRIETGCAQEGLPGAGSPDGVEEHAEEVLGNEGAPVIQIAARTQLCKVSGTVDIGQVLQAFIVRIDTATAATLKGVGRVGAMSAAGPGRRGYRKLMRHIKRGRPDAGKSSTRFMAGHVRPRNPHAVGSTTMPTLPATSETPTTMTATLTATSADDDSTRQPVTETLRTR
jgi:hypothetical protein